MSDTMHARLTQYGFLAVYLVAMNLLMLANVFLAGRNLSTLVLLPLVAGSAVLTLRYFKNAIAAPSARFTPLDLVVAIYFVYSIVSLLLYLQPGNPASPEAYAYGLNVQVLPMLMYFAVRGIGDHDFRRIIGLLVALQVACALIGIALFFLRPDYYSDFLWERLVFNEDWQIYGRLQSYMGSTATGILSAVAIVLLLNVNLSRLLRYALWLLLLLTVLLTQQRGAYVSGFLATLFLLYKVRLNPLQFGIALVAMFAVLLAVLNYLGLTGDLFLGTVKSRIVEDLIFGDPLGERADAYQKGLGFLSEFPLGLGLGATTSAADDAGAHFNGQVVDAYYMRIACDLGVIGLVLFVAVLVLAAYSSNRNGMVQGFTLIVIIYAIQSTGTNVLDSYYVSHVFWMLLGYVGAGSARTVDPSLHGQVIRARFLQPLERADMRLERMGQGR